MHYGNIQPNPLESKVWLSMNGRLKTYNKHTKQWGPSTNEQPDTPTEPEVPVNPWDNIANGVYAVSADYKPIDYNTADDTAIGVAVVAGNYKFMIAKNDATDGTNNDFYWTKGKSDLSLTNYSNVDGTNRYGYLPKPDGTFEDSPHLSDDFTTWTAGALSDFNGESNTAVITTASSNERSMCTVLNTFNSSDSHSDWYIPACGQLALMYLNMTEINAALAKIGGTTLASELYWSSSEKSFGYAWYMYLASGNVSSSNGKVNLYRVRFIRDIQE